MVNRRILRIKAVKNLFALENCKQANKELAIEKIHQDFAHDLNSMEPYDAERKKKLRGEAVRYFESRFEEGSETPEIEEESRKSADAAHEYYENLNRADFAKAQKDLKKDFDKIRQNQLLVWKLVKELAIQNKKVVQEKATLAEKFGQPIQAATPLYHNKVLQKILETPAVEDALTKEAASWANEEDKIRSWYKSILRKQEFFVNYLAKAQPSEEDDFEALNQIVRNVVFKVEAIEIFFDESDINWNENKQIVRSLVLKTLKSFNEEEIVMPPLSYNWDEDLEYYTSLFANTVRNHEYYESLIQKKVKNWKIDRLAALDKVILKSAICEMVTFQSIPVKVTINEFIEISKTYSTPKSKKFVNGLLDAISEDLINSGEIKKSGRGLIDSK